MNSSARVHRTQTGRPAALASRAASIAASALCLPPNPPPMSGMMTRTCSSDRPNARARSPLRTIRPVAARPDGELAVGPFRDAGSRLHRRVLDIGQRVGLAEGLGRIGEALLDIAPRVGPPPAGLGVLLEIRVNRLARRRMRDRSSRWRSWPRPPSPASPDAARAPRTRRTGHPARRPRPSSPWPRTDRRIPAWPHMRADAGPFRKACSAGRCPKGYRCAPVTRSRKVGLGTETPITFQSLTGVSVTSDRTLCAKASATRSFDLARSA